jgi:hypothetical protein
VVESSFDQVNNILTVKIHRGLTSTDAIIRELKSCKIRCAHRNALHEMAQIKHKAIGSKKDRDMPAGHEMAGMEHESMKMGKLLPKIMR